MPYLFDTPIPIPWLLADLLTLLVTLLVVVFIVRKGKHPVAILLESADRVRGGGPVEGERWARSD